MSTTKMTTMFTLPSTQFVTFDVELSHSHMIAVTSSMAMVTSKDESKGTVGGCVAQDGYGRKCSRPRLPWSLYCQHCYNDTRGVGL